MNKLTKILTIFAAVIFVITGYAQTNTWEPLGSGTTNGNGTNGHVYAITSFNGKIIFGGSFTQAGGVNAQNIAQYDPATNTWSPISTGITGEVKALTVRGSELIAGGEFNQAGITAVNNIANWNGSNWLALGSGVSGEVLALTLYSGDLIAGGNFTSAGGGSANNIAKWNGTTWSALGSGLTGSGDRVNALTLHQGNLIAAGRFTSSGPSSMSNIAKWNGSSWSQINSSSFSDDINAVISFNGDLYAGGHFDHVGGNDIKYLARYNGSNWSQPGGGLDDGDVNVLAIYKNTLIVGGNFRVTGTNLFVDRIAMWSGTTWSRMLTGNNDRVYALFTQNSTDTILYAGGEFTVAGGKWSYHASKWGSFSTSEVSGLVRYSDNNQSVLSGWVKIIRFDVVTREIITVDSARISSGTYLLRRVPQRDTNMRIIAFPDDELDGGLDTGYVPTYYPSTINWTSAGVIYAPGNLTNININVIRENKNAALNSLAANISGYVYLNIAPPCPAGVLNGFPFLKGSVVYLKKDTSFVKFAVSNDNEAYSLSGVNPGTYSLNVQRLGYETETRTIIVGGTNQDTVNFYLDTLSVIGIVNINNITPDNFELSQNYPNPFNPETKIRFALKTAAYTELKIFDMLGREVKTLVNENLKTGEYEVTFKASNLPSGAYFYRLRAADYNETKKMIIIK
ncbi:MAG: T9SS type A sorting domain-containing protein [Ignavibacteria bacterium]|nr:T9SS type A sorting domain-containing protein [Ignavibacteria bacterium]